MTSNLENRNHRISMSYQRTPEHENVRLFASGADGRAYLIRSTRTGKYGVKKVGYIQYRDPPIVSFEAHIYFAILRGSSWFTTRPISFDFVNATNVCNVYLEFCDGGSLDRFLKEMKGRKMKVPESFLWHVLFHLSIGSLFLHTGIQYDTKSKKPMAGPKVMRPAIVHHDLHPGNVLIRHNRLLDGTSRYPDVVLTDFGRSRVIGCRSMNYWPVPVEDELDEDAIKTEYVSFSKSGSNESYHFPRPPKDVREDFKSIYELILLLCAPGRSDDIEHHNPDLLKKYSQELQDLMRTMGDIDAEERPSDIRLLDLLPYLQEQRDAELELDVEFGKLIPADVWAKEDGTEVRSGEALSGTGFTDEDEMDDAADIALPPGREGSTASAVEEMISSDSTSSLPLGDGVKL